MKIIIVTQARSGSTRLPNKILKEVNGETLLKIHIDRIKKSKNATDIIVATTDKLEDDIIETQVKKMGVEVFRGAENDVLDRFYQSVKEIRPDLIVRLTSDCPLIDPELIDSVIDKTISDKVDYCSNCLIESFPDGQDIEVFTFKALKEAWSKATLNSQREHVTPYIRENSSFYERDTFTSVNFMSEYPEYSNVRMTVDEQSDFKMITKLIDKLGTEENWEKYAELYLNDISINKLNRNITRNEGYFKSLKKD